MARDHAAIALQYAQAVASGAIWTSKWTKAACQRHLDDLARQGTPEFPYRFDAAKGAKACRFAELFHVFEGPLAGKNIELMPWQCLLWVSIFGWTCDGGPRDGKRRFRRVILEMPRGSSKTTLGAILGIYITFAEGEGGSQGVTAGTSRDVARLSFNAAQAMLRRETDLCRALGIDVLAHTIIQKKTSSKFNPISADTKTSDGKNLHFCLFDEAWAFKHRTLYDSLETGTAKRDNSLMVVAGTAGFDTASVAYELRTYVTKILDGQHTDESTFGLIYCAPEGHEDRWMDLDVMQAANPSWGVTVMPEVVQQLAEKAKVAPASINSFKVKFLNIWCSADMAWMDMTKWRAMSDPTLDIDDFQGEPVVLGLDLATVSDIAAKIYIFKREIDGKQHYYLFTSAYLPETAVAMGQNSQYRGWEEQGLLTVSSGSVTDFTMIEDDLLEDMRKFQVQSVGFDPWHASQLAQRMMAQGVNMVEVRMNVSSLSEPMKLISALILQGRLHHNSPILDHHVGNVTCVEDRNSNIFPRKQRAESKIDCAVASIIAMALAMGDEQSSTSIYESRGFFELGAEPEEPVKTDAKAPPPLPADIFDRGWSSFR